MGLRYKIALVLGLALAAAFTTYTLLGPGGGGKRTVLQEELDRLLEENRVIKEQNRQLSLEVEGLRQRRDYLEKVARDELGLIKKDELIIQVVEGQPDGGPVDGKR